MLPIYWRRIAAALCTAVHSVCTTAYFKYFLFHCLSVLQRLSLLSPRRGALLKSAQRPTVFSTILYFWIEYWTIMAKVSNVSTLTECAFNNQMFIPFVGWKKKTQIGINFTDLRLAASARQQHMPHKSLHNSSLATGPTTFIAVPSLLSLHTKFILQTYAESVSMDSRKSRKAGHV
jgi:hypothetical protein